MITNTEAQNRRIYEQWHEMIVKRDLDGLMALYAKNAVLDSAAVLAQ
jgi:steroid Delta-isomerase